MTLNNKLPLKVRARVASDLVQYPRSWVDVWFYRLTSRHRCEIVNEALLLTLVRNIYARPSIIKTCAQASKGAGGVVPVKNSQSSQRRQFLRLDVEEVDNRTSRYDISKWFQ